MNRGKIKTLNNVRKPTKITNVYAQIAGCLIEVLYGKHY